MNCSIRPSMRPLAACIVLFLMACWPRMAASQSYVNPDTIQQSGDIYLQNTDVYYCPFAPPDSTDTREALCALSDVLLDANGIGNLTYNPMVHGHIPLANWCPCYDTMRGAIYPYQKPLGPYVAWQRLFQARNKPDGTHSDIIVGSNVTTDTAHSHGYGPVIVSKNEDVDFRATGTIKFESGTHFMPGSFVHAYIEPKWGDSVFSDEFSDTAKFHNQWYAVNGNKDDQGGSQCNFDTDVHIVQDTGVNGAHDGWALDLMLRLRNDTDSCSCNRMGFSYMDTCHGSPLDTANEKTLFYSAMLRSCPYPFTQTTAPLGTATYTNAPYGKYEFRDKIPDILHHTNNWGGDGDLEFDLNESQHAPTLGMGIVAPDWGHHFRYGPAHGFFAWCKDIHITDPLHDSVWCFISHDAGWNGKNGATAIYVENFNYAVAGWDFVKDTVQAVPPLTLQGGFPSSLIHSGDTFTCYYELYNVHPSDVVTWTVDTVSDGSWRSFRAPYDTTGGTPYFFNRTNQPTQITLTYDLFHHQKTYGCYWDSLRSALSYPDTGFLYLTDSMSPTDLHSNTESYTYESLDVGARGFGYPVPPVQLGPDTVTADTSIPYKYHTYTMEFLPHEVRFLYDSVVVRRIPDRLIPPGNRYYDWVGTYARAPNVLRPAEFVIDYNGDAVSELTYFQAHASDCNGCWPDQYGNPTAHHLLDYVKVWDLPAGANLPPFPH